MERVIRLIVIPWFVCIGMYMTIWWVWSLIDIAEFGSPQKSISDTLMAIVITWLLYDKIMPEWARR